jgi:hypothetical protein
MAALRDLQTLVGSQATPVQAQKSEIELTESYLRTARQQLQQQQLELDQLKGNMRSMSVLIIQGNYSPQRLLQRLSKLRTTN